MGDVVSRLLRAFSNPFHLRCGRYFLIYVFASPFLEGAVFDKSPFNALNVYLVLLFQKLYIWEKGKRKTKGFNGEVSRRNAFSARNFRINTICFSFTFLLITLYIGHSKASLLCRPYFLVAVRNNTFHREHLRRRCNVLLLMSFFYFSNMPKRGDWRVMGSCHFYLFYFHLGHNLTT